LAFDIKAAAARWFEDLWVHRREAIIDELAHPDATTSVEGTDGKLTLEEFRLYRRAMLSAIPDFAVEVQSIIANGDICHVQWRATGTHTGYGLGIPPSGKDVVFTGLTVFEFRDGRIMGGMDKWNRGEMIASLMQVRMDDIRAAAGLTQREAQVALLMAERFSHAEIADQLHIKANTARRHCERVLQKLRVKRRQDVAAALGKIPGSVLDRHVIEP
jgi:predicted ester cyclase/DNA-binding CsgD family transcriptional regulator